MQWHRFIIRAHIDDDIIEFSGFLTALYSYSFCLSYMLCWIISLMVLLWCLCCLILVLWCLKFELEFELLLVSSCVCGIDLHLVASCSSVFSSSLLLLIMVSPGADAVYPHYMVYPGADAVYPHYMVSPGADAVYPHYIWSLQGLMLFTLIIWSLHFLFMRKPAWPLAVQEWYNRWLIFSLLQF